MNTREELLIAKVAAVNRANKYATQLFGELTEGFAPLVGQKILKADGTLLAKYVPLWPLVTDDQILVYRLDSEYSLGWVVKSHEDILGSCVYHSTTIYVGDMSGQTLKNMAVNPFEGRFDFTVEEIIEKRAAYASAKKVADSFQTALYPFGEFDR